MHMLLASPNDITVQNCIAVATTVEILINSLTACTHQIKVLWFLFILLLVRTSISFAVFLFQPLLYKNALNGTVAINFGKPCLEVQ